MLDGQGRGEGCEGEVPGTLAPQHHNSTTSLRRIRARLLRSTAHRSLDLVYMDINNINLLDMGVKRDMISKMYYNTPTTLQSNAYKRLCDCYYSYCNTTIITIIPIPWHPFIPSWLPSRIAYLVFPLCCVFVHHFCHPPNSNRGLERGGGG